MKMLPEFGNLKDHIDLEDSLLRRKTTRNFDNSYRVSNDTFSSLIRVISSHKNMTNLEVYINILEVEDVEPGLYKLNLVNESLTKERNALSRDEIRQLIIGQEWAGDGSFHIFLRKVNTLQEPYSFLIDLMDLGRIGQSIYLTATDKELGVFSTPATQDEVLHDTLEIENRLNSLFYFITVGKGKR